MLSALWWGTDGSGKGEQLVSTPVWIYQWAT